MPEEQGVVELLGERRRESCRAAHADLPLRAIAGNGLEVEVAREQRGSSARAEARQAGKAVCARYGAPGLRERTHRLAEKRAAS